MFRLFFSFRSCAALTALTLTLAPIESHAQDPAPMPESIHMHHDMPMSEEPLGLGATRAGSGTSWLPDASETQGLMATRGRWMLMLHGNGFVQYLRVDGYRGGDQFGSINWIMGMAERSLAGGRLTVRGMFSAEPATVGKCGYPTLLATGESCNGAALHDRQHPHDMFMETAASYRRALGRDLAFEVYGGPAGEPALGPVAFPHRPSAMPNPIAPIAHHWLDATHVSFGVVTGGVYGRRWKAEASAFNGREPDDARYDFDTGALDSYSARVFVNPTRNLSFQLSSGHLTAAERHDGVASDVDRATASATYQRLAGDRLTAITAAWGRNRDDDVTTSAALVEAAVDTGRTYTVFGRVERVGKTAHDLVLPAPFDGVFTVMKVQVGVVNWVGTRGGVRVGLGSSAGVSVVPETITGVYGGRGFLETAIFVTIRPGRRQ